MINPSYKYLIKLSFLLHLQNNCIQHGGWPERPYFCWILTLTLVGDFIAEPRFLGSLSVFHASSYCEVFLSTVSTYSSFLETCCWELSLPTSTEIQIRVGIYVPPEKPLINHKYESMKASVLLLWDRTTFRCSLQHRIHREIKPKLSYPLWNLPQGLLPLPTVLPNNPFSVSHWSTSLTNHLQVDSYLSVCCRGTWFDMLSFLLFVLRPKVATYRKTSEIHRNVFILFTWAGTYTHG